MHNLYSYKSTSLQLKDIDTVTGVVSGYFASFDTLDSDGDIFVKGAFAKTIKELGPTSAKPRIKHLLDHNTTKVPGVLTELYEDNVGLAYVSKLALNTITGKDTLGMYMDGIITEHSNGTQFIKTEQTDAGQLLKEVRMWEGSSLQAWGANYNTPVTGVKSAVKPDMENLFSRMDKLTKAMRGSYSDETMELFEIEYNQIKQAIKSLTEPPAPGTQSEPTEEAILESLKSFKNTLKTL